MAALAGIVAHGGTGGLIAELVIALVIAVPIGIAWLRERRRSQREGPRPPARLRDDD